MEYSLQFSYSTACKITRAIFLAMLFVIMALAGASGQSFVTELNSHRTHKLEIRKDRHAKAWCEKLAKYDGRSHDLKNRRSKQSEIILGNQIGESACYKQWEESPPHKRIMLDERYDYIAFYIVKKGDMYYAIARLWEK